MWSRTGKELFFLTGTSTGARILSVAVKDEGSGFSYSNPQVMVEGPYYVGTVLSRNYDVSPDGRRFLVIKAPADDPASSRVFVVVNFQEDLNRRVPPRSVS